jgi:magnesium-protoporphyrin O-methyltransferase
MATSPAPDAGAKLAEKAEVRDYFNSTGFERWKRIYSDSDDVNKVQRNIRLGHQKTVDQVLEWLQEEGDLPQRSFCDAGCGVGSLSLPLAQLGAGSIAASDLSEAMVEEARHRLETSGIGLDRVQFSASDLESLQGRYDTVVCLDVFIHYPQAAAEEMVRHLGGLAERQLFPGPSKTTRAYTLREDGIVAAAAEAGFRPKRRSLNQAPFYFSRLIEFERS